MKHQTLAVVLAAVLWLILSVTSLASRWVIGDWLAAGAGLLLVASIALLWRRTVLEFKRWRNALDAMQAGIVLYDAQDRLVLVNADFRRLYDRPGHEAVEGEHFETLIRSRVKAGLVPEATGQEESWIAKRLAQHRSPDSQSFVREMADGRWRRITEQRLSDGGSLGFSIDVTELIEQQRAADVARRDAEVARRTLEDAIEALPDGFALFDAQDRLVLCNQRYRDIYRDSAPAMQLGATFEAIVRYGLERGQYPQAAADPQAWLTQRVRRHKESDGVPILQELGGNRWLRIDERRTRDGGIAGVRTDVTELVQARQQLEQLSSTDSLTGLANRRRFDQGLSAELRRATREGRPLALLLVDVDHFKLYNDHHGHPAGDRALQTVAAVLALQAQRPGELVARYGGEEFALVLPHADAATARNVAERCRLAMAERALPHGHSPTAAHVTFSIGAAVHRSRERESAEQLLRRADAALYAAKAAGRAQCVTADDAPAA